MCNVYDCRISGKGEGGHFREWRVPTLRRREYPGAQTPEGGARIRVTGIEPAPHGVVNCRKVAP